MLNYLIRALAGGIAGYIFGFGTGVGLTVWMLRSDIVGPRAGTSILAFLLILACQSALLGVTAGLASGRARGWRIIWQSVPVSALVGLLLVQFALVILGRPVGPNGEYLIAAQPARHVASVNMLWGGLIGLIVGLVLLPFYRGLAEESPTLEEPRGESVLTTQGAGS